MDGGGLAIHRAEVTELIEHFKKIEVERSDGLKLAAVKVKKKKKNEKNYY